MKILILILILANLGLTNEIKQAATTAIGLNILDYKNEKIDLESVTSKNIVLQLTYGLEYKNTFIEIEAKMTSLALPKETNTESCSLPLNDFSVNCSEGSSNDNLDLIDVTDDEMLIDNLYFIPSSGGDLINRYYSAIEAKVVTGYSLSLLKQFKLGIGIGGEYVYSSLNYSRKYSGINSNLYPQFFITTVSYEAFLQFSPQYIINANNTLLMSLILSPFTYSNVRTSRIFYDNGVIVPSRGKIGDSYVLKNEQINYSIGLGYKKVISNNFTMLIKYLFKSNKIVKANVITQSQHLLLLEFGLIF